MPKDYGKPLLFQPAEPPAGLFDRIIFAIKNEQELRHTKRLLFVFLSLLLISLVITPLSGTMLIKQAKSSGIFYFAYTAFSDLGIFFALWQDFGLAILESLPLMGMMAFAVSLGLSVFTVRLFLHRKRLLFRYLTHSFA